MAKASDRFEKTYSQGTMNVTEIWVDKTTGVNYLFHVSGYAGGLKMCIRDSSFIDWDRDFLPESVLDSRYETTVKAEFQKYLDTYPNSKPGMPLFFEVKDGVVQEIYEEPMA